jgi:hypothetical protein
MTSPPNHVALLPLVLPPEPTLSPNPNTHALLIKDHNHRTVLELPTDRYEPPHPHLPLPLIRHSFDQLNVEVRRPCQHALPRAQERRTRGVGRVVFMLDLSIRSNERGGKTQVVSVCEGSEECGGERPEPRGCEWIYWRC